MTILAGGTPDIGKMRETFSAMTSDTYTESSSPSGRSA